MRAVGTSGVTSDAANVDLIDGAVANTEKDIDEFHRNQEMTTPKYAINKATKV